MELSWYRGLRDYERNLALSVWRVRRAFGWDGWQYNPRTSIADESCICVHNHCPRRFVGDGCRCRCDCGCTGPDGFGRAGNIFVAPEGHPRLEMMLASRAVVYDATLDRDQILAQPQYKRLVRPISGTGVQRRKLYRDG